MKIKSSAIWQKALRCRADTPLSSMSLLPMGNLLESLFEFLAALVRFDFTGGFYEE